jgi:hypothetical protein
MHVMQVIDCPHGGGAEVSLLEVIPRPASRDVRSSMVALLPDDDGRDHKVSALGITYVRLRNHDPLGLARTDVPDVMCATDVLSFPSRREGRGSTYVEAVAPRLGMAAADIPPVAETIGDIGCPLVRTDEVQVLSDKLSPVLEGGTVIEARKDAGERRFRALFSEEAASDGMAQFCMDIFRATRRRP